MIAAIPNEEQDAVSAPDGSAPDDAGPGSPDGRARDEPLPAELSRGIEHFNARRFFEAHDVVEEIWRKERRQVRSLYQGIVQLSVAFHHLRGGNWRGATKLLARGLDRIRPFAPSWHGLDLGRLVADADRCLGSLHALGPERLDRFDEALLPMIHGNR